MKHQLKWQGLIYNSVEDCTIEQSGKGTEVSSFIRGNYEGLVFSVQYSVSINPAWETLKAEIKSVINGKERICIAAGNGKGSWLLNGKPEPLFDGCIDIDIPLTPFTNTLPIRRLKMADRQRQLIKVLYLDVLAQTETALTQQYQRLSGYEYHYQNVPNDFEAVIAVDENGFVVNYPVLFKRKEG